MICKSFVESYTFTRPFPISREIEGEVTKYELALRKLSADKMIGRISGIILEEYHY